MDNRRFNVGYIRSIFYRLCLSCEVWPSLTLKIIKSPSNDGYISGNVITLSHTLLKNIGTDYDQIAFLLGHEIGHYILGHCRFGYLFDSHRCEFNADKFSAELMRDAGYNVQRGIKLFDSFDIQHATKTHPSVEERINRLTNS